MSTALNSLEGRCATLKHSFWSYKWCHREGIIQVRRFRANRGLVQQQKNRLSSMVVAIIAGIIIGTAPRGCLPRCGASEYGAVSRSSCPLFLVVPKVYTNKSFSAVDLPTSKFKRFCACPYGTCSMTAVKCPYSTLDFRASCSPRPFHVALSSAGLFFTLLWRVWGAACPIMRFGCLPLQQKVLGV